MLFVDICIGKVLLRTHYLYDIYSNPNLNCVSLHLQVCITYKIKSSYILLTLDVSFRNNKKCKFNYKAVGAIFYYNIKREREREERFVRTQHGLWCLNKMMSHGQKTLSLINYIIEYMSCFCSSFFFPFLSLSWTWSWGVVDVFFFLRMCLNIAYYWKLKTKNNITK